MHHLRFFLLVSAILYIYPIVLHSAENTSSHIQRVTVQSTTEKEQIHLHFLDRFKESASPHFDPGFVKITLPDTDFVAGTEINHVNNRFIQNIRLYKEGKNSIVEIQFADRDFQAIGRVSTYVEAQTLSIVIDKTRKSSDSDTGNKSIFEGITKGSEAQPLSFSSELNENSDITINIVKMLLAVTAILLFFYGILWIYNRFFVSRFHFKKGDHSIRLVTSYHISPKQKIVILDVDHTTYACGVTPNSISLISEVTDKSFYNYLSRLKPDHEKGIDFSHLRTQYLESKISKSNKNSIQSDTPFATELLNKVKKLKPID